MKAKKDRHKLIWFTNRVGQWLVKNGSVDMFNPPIQIASIMHAKALYISQREKGYSYSETI